MLTILAVDTSATPVSCAVLRDGCLLASYYAHTKLTHSQTLMPMIEHTLYTNRLTMQDIDVLAVNSGPGSFTGVRIGVSAVKGLAFADKKPCVEVSTLESIAEGFRGLPLDAVICCAMDARCQQVYTALFEVDAAGNVTRLSEDEALSLDTLKERLLSLGKPVIFAGDGAALCVEVFKDTAVRHMLSPLALRYQNAACVAAVAAIRLAEGKVLTDEALLPQYLRLPQAERELRARQGLV